MPTMFYMLPAGNRGIYNTNGRPSNINSNSATMIVTSSSNATPTYWVTNTPVQGACNSAGMFESSILQQQRTASSGLLMNIGYLNNGHGPPNAMGPGTDSELGDELSPLPRPASAGAAAVVSGAAGLHENSVLYDYPPSLSVHVNSSRHRGTSLSLRKQHSVSCASHCCEVAAAASGANGLPKV